MKHKTEVRLEPSQVDKIVIEELVKIVFLYAKNDPLTKGAMEVLSYYLTRDDMKKLKKKCEKKYWNNE